MLLASPTSAQSACERTSGAIRIEFESDVLSPAQVAEVVRELGVSLRLRARLLELGGPLEGHASVRVGRDPSSEEPGRLSINVLCEDVVQRSLLFDAQGIQADLVPFTLARAIDEVLRYARVIASPPGEPVPEEPRAAEPAASPPPVAPVRAIEPRARVALAGEALLFSTLQVQLGGAIDLGFEYDRLALELTLHGASAPALQTPAGAITTTTFGPTLAFMMELLEEGAWCFALGPSASVLAVWFGATPAGDFVARDAWSYAFMLGGRTSLAWRIAQPWYLRARLDMQAVVKGAQALADSAVASRIDGAAFTIALAVGAEWH